jgi:MFS family permease
MNGRASNRHSAIPRAIWTLGFVSLLTDVSSEMVHALLPVFLVSELGASFAAVGLIEGIAEATAAITKIFSGVLSDWLGRRKALAAIGYGLSAIAKPAFPLAASIGWIVAARFVDRVGKGVRDAPRDALVADLAPQEARGASMGLRQALDTVGAFLGPLLAIGLMALTANRFRVVFWVGVVPAFLAVALLVVGVREPLRPTRGAPGFPLSFPRLRRLGAIFWLAVTTAVAFSLACFSDAFLILRARDAGLPIALAPAVLVVMNVVYAATAYPAGALSDRFGRLAVLAAGFAILIVADLTLAFASGLTGMAAGVALWGLQMGVTKGALAALVADAAPPDSRGSAYGIFNFASGLALLVASVLFGVLWDRTGPAAAFFASALFAAAAIASLLLLRQGLIGRAVKP